MYSAYALVRSDLSAKSHRRALVQAPRASHSGLKAINLSYRFSDHTPVTDLADLADLPDLAVFFILTDGPISIAHHLVY